MDIKKQAGFVSIEALAVLLVTITGMTIGFQWIQAEHDLKMNRVIAEQATIFSDATAKWMKDNYSAIDAAATPLAQYSPEAIAAYLSPTFSKTNAYGQTYSIRIYKAAANQLQAMIVTTGGSAIGEQNIRKIAQLLGAKGGYVSSADINKAQGAYGGWSMPFNHFGGSPGSGKLAVALFFQDGALVSDFLYRNKVPGHPELNKMNTAIDMGGNNLNKAGTVDAAMVISSGNIVAHGHVTATGNVSANSDVTAANAHISGQTYTGGWFRTQGDGGWYSDKWAGGWYMNDPSWVRSYNDKNVYTGGQMRAGTMHANGRLSTGEFVQIDGIAAEGSGCAPNGLVGRDHAGAILSCHYGIWKSNRGSANNYPFVCWKKEGWAYAPYLFGRFSSLPPGALLAPSDTWQWFNHGSDRGGFGGDFMICWKTAD